MSAAETRLVEQLGALKLRALIEPYATLATEAAQKQWPHVDYLARLMDSETQRRHQLTIERRVAAARFPCIKTLDQFDWTWPKTINRPQVQNLFRLAFLKDKTNVIFLGGVGLGKTHLASALAHEACLRGHSVFFTTAVDIINTWTAAQTVGRLKPELKRYLKPTVLAVDELGYLPIVTRVGDRGMIGTDQKAAAQQAGFHFVTALTKPQIQKLLADKVLPMELFEEKVHDVLGEDGRRFVLRRNPLRQEELQRTRQQKQQSLEAALKKANTFLDEHPRAKVATQRRKLAARLESLKVQDWLKLTLKKQRLVLTPDAPALQAAAQLDGCHVVETDLKAPQADAQTIHDRYKDLAFVERDFRTLKTGHREFRPWFVCTEDNTQAHVLTSMLALKIRRHLERAWWPLEVTVEEGLRELETLCVMELVHPQSGAVVARQVPEPSARHQQLLEALQLGLPATVPQAEVIVGTRKKINRVRKPLET